MCNLKCSYCYLPGRSDGHRMALDTTNQVAEELHKTGNYVEIIWHGGEPLSCGFNHFSQLALSFEDLRESGFIHHGIQSNATLIDERWCEFFHDHEFRVGISLDGPPWANTRRVGRDGKPAYRRIMVGIQELKKANIPFSIICVVSHNDLGKANDLYNFFTDIGCASLGINIEERLGANTNKSPDDNYKIVRFWRELFSAWRANPIIKMRDFDRVLSSLSLLSDDTPPVVPELYDIFPSIAWNGDVVLLAPEFLNTVSNKYGSFIVGNVHRDSFIDIIRKGNSVQYIQDYVHGIERCNNECEYFPICYGGQAGNKFSEHGTIDATETAFCRNSEMRLADAILEELI